MGAWDIEILATIADADEHSVDELLDHASSLGDDGADFVVLSGSGRPWPELPEIVQELWEESRRVAVANATPVDLLTSVPHGIELVFPADSEQQEAAVGAGCEVVVKIGEKSKQDVERIVQSFAKQGVPYCVELGLQPIGMGLAESIARHVEFPSPLARDPNRHVTGCGRRQRLLSIPPRSISFSSGSVRNSARVRLSWAVTTTGIERPCGSAIWPAQMTCYFKKTMAPPGDVETGLLMLRDAAVLEFGQEELDRLAEVLKDPSPRLYAEGDRLHAVSNGKHLESTDPYDLFDQIVGSTDRDLDASKAFYLGYEMAKAMTALTLSKTYRQDEALEWGMLTQRELTRLERRALRLARLRDGECEETREYFEEDDLDDAFGEPAE